MKKINVIPPTKIEMPPAIQLDRLKRENQRLRKQTSNRHKREIESFELRMRIAIDRNNAIQSQLNLALKDYTDIRREKYDLETKHQTLEDLSKEANRQLVLANKKIDELNGRIESYKNTNGTMHGVIQDYQLLLDFIRKADTFGPMKANPENQK